MPQVFISNGEVYKVSASLVEDIVKQQKQSLKLAEAVDQLVQDNADLQQIVDEAMKPNHKLVTFCDQLHVNQILYFFNFETIIEDTSVHPSSLCTISKSSKISLSVSNVILSSS